MQARLGLWGCGTECTQSARADDVSFHQCMAARDRIIWNSSDATGWPWYNEVIIFRSVFPRLGNSRFVNLFHSSRYWQDYRNSVYPFYPVLVNIHQFEVDLCAFLENRNSKYEETLARIQSNDMSWLSLVFAVLACGAQFSNDSSKERDLMSKVFGKPLPFLQLFFEYCYLHWTQFVPHSSASGRQISSSPLTLNKYNRFFSSEVVSEITPTPTLRGFSSVRIIFFLTNLCSLCILTQSPSFRYYSTPCSKYRFPWTICLPRGSIERQFPWRIREM